MMRFSMSTFSTIGKKIFMGLSGLLLCGFIVFHLIGNLALLNPDPDPFNKYSNFLTHQLGSFIYLLEAGLAAVFLIHFIYAIIVTINNWRARPHNYKMVTNAHYTSRKNISSVTMIWTGLVVIVFLVWHLMHFKYGQMLMTTTADGTVLRDLYATVYQFYGNIVNVVLYVLVMALLGFHLFHGFWSAFQSLGLYGKRFTPFIYVVGSIFAVVMAVGFIFLPVWIYVITGGAS